MANRPRDLADRMAVRRQAKSSAKSVADGFIRETFALSRAQGATTGAGLPDRLPESRLYDRGRELARAAE